MKPKMLHKFLEWRTYSDLPPHIPALAAFVEINMENYKLFNSAMKRKKASEVRSARCANAGLVTGGDLSEKRARQGLST